MEQPLEPLLARARSEKVVSTSHRFLWVGVPKSATRSMLQVLVRKPPVDFGAEVHVEPLAELLAAHPAWREHFVFTFVRNPWSRVVSTWRNKIQDPTPETIEFILDHFEQLEPGMPFEAFVDFLASDGGADEHADRHWLSQHLFLRDRDGELAVDFTGRIESMQDDFPVVASRIGLDDVGLPWLNTHLGWRPDPEQAEDSSQRDYWRDHYTDRTRDLVAQRYAADVELFGYEF